MLLKRIRLANTFLLILVFSVIGLGQTVQSVDYYLKYDSTTCWWDFHIIILEGYAEGIGQRTQFNAQISVVVPTGSTVTFAEKYMPLQNNQFYGGTIPLNWNFGVPVIDPGSSPGNDFISIFPTLAPTSQYNNIYAGDTIKLFSLNIDAVSACGQGVRLYENGIDPSSQDEDMNGADFSNGFTIGGITQLYNGNAPKEGPLPPDIVSLLDNSSGNDISIDLEIAASNCQGAVDFSWSGPNGFSSTNEDVSINGAQPGDYGIFEVIISDSIGCADTTNITIDMGMPEVNEITSTELILNATYEHISAHLNIEGDDNHNSSVLFEYKLKGTSTFQSSADWMRAFPEMIVDGNALNENFHAGSALFLQPNSEYDLRLTLTDPDGGGTVINTSYSTHKMPVQPENGNILYVAPGNGGGNGTIGNPYLGIQDAVDNANPGDIIEVANGTYSPFTMTAGGLENQPITIRSTNLHGAIIDGGNTSTGIVTIGSFSDSIQHIILDGFEIRNGSWGIDAQNTQYLTVKNNKIYDVDFGFYNRRENGWEHDQYLTNNEITGRTLWPQLNGEIPSERGVDIRGNRNVVSYNSISNFGDGISTDGAPYKTSYALDIHHNFINKIVDDLIEIDGVLSNARVYQNVGFNGRMGVSVAPVFGGPAYIFRNEFYNLETSAFKMNRSPAGLYIVNNTIIKEGRGTTSDSGWQNTVFKNNAIASSHYCFEEYGLVSDSNDEWNYNGYLSLRNGTSAEPWFKWDNIKYNDMPALNSSGILGLNSKEIELNDFMQVVIPADYSIEALLGNVNINPPIGSDLINSGVNLNNINLPFVTDGLTDIGARENGMPDPEIGHDFDEVCEREDLSVRTWNGSVSQAWYLPQNWTPCGVPTSQTNVTIPAGCAQYPFVNSDIIMNNLNVLHNGSIIVRGENVEVKLVGINP